MDILEVNEYLNAASDALQDDPEYFHWIQALGDARKQALDECDCYTDKVEGCLWQIYARQVKYILENKEKIDKKIAAFELATELDGAVERSEREGRVDEEAILISEGLDDYESKRGIDGKESLKSLKEKHGLECSDIERKLDEADNYAETIPDRMLHEEVFDAARVTFRQITEKTMNVYGSDVTTIYQKIGELKDNPDEIDFDKDCDGVVIEARLNP